MFERILDFPKKKKGPYRGIRQVVKPKYLVKTLNIPVSDLAPHYKTNGDTRGLQRGYLEKKSWELASAQKWESFGDVLALLIFGLALFPNLDNFIDTTIISVLWAIKVKE